MMRRILLVFAGFILSGCASVGPPAAIRPETERRGLVNWRWGDDRSLTADLTMALDAGGNLDLSVVKSSRLIQLARRGNHWTVSGPLAGIPWSGPRENAPLRLAGWITLADTLASIENAPQNIDAWMSGMVRARWTSHTAEIIATETGEHFRVRWR